MRTKLSLGQKNPPDYHKHLKLGVSSSPTNRPHAPGRIFSVANTQTILRPVHACGQLRSVSRSPVLRMTSELADELPSVSNNPPKAIFRTKSQPSRFKRPDG